MLSFANKTALVTGAGQGLGREFALELAARGCTVMLNDLMPSDLSKRASLEAICEEIIATGGQAYCIYGDVVTDAEKIIAAALEQAGGLDIIINNAGVLVWLPFAEMTQAAFERVQSVHLSGTVNILRAAWPVLKKSTTARVVNLSSAASFGLENGAPYATAKAAIIGLTRSLALEGAQQGIHINAVMPLGYTDMSATMPEPFRSMFKDNLPASAVAPFVAWLAHEQCELSGEIFSVGGGRVARVLFGEAEGVIASSNTSEQWAKLQSQLMSHQLSILPATSFDEAIASLDALGVNMDVLNG